MPIRPPKGKIICIPIFDSDFFNEEHKIYRPDMYKERVDHGVVKRIGPEVDIDISIGEIAVFSGYTGTLVSIDDELIIIVPQDFISCTITPDALEVPGLFLQSADPFQDENYFPATYDKALELIALAYMESDWNHKLNIKVAKPKPEEITWK